MQGRRWGDGGPGHGDGQLGGTGARDAGMQVGGRGPGTRGRPAGGTGTLPLCHSPDACFAPPATAPPRGQGPVEAGPAAPRPVPGRSPRSQPPGLTLPWPREGFLLSQALPRLYTGSSGVPCAISRAPSPSGVGPAGGLRGAEPTPAEGWPGELAGQPLVGLPVGERGCSSVGAPAADAPPPPWLAGVDR